MGGDKNEFSNVTEADVTDLELANHSMSWILKRTVQVVDSFRV